LALEPLFRRRKLVEARGDAMRERAEALLARWREAERRHAQASAGSLEWEQTRRDVVEERRRYQEAVDEVTSLGVREPEAVGQSAD
jgi:hypothetical protein